MFAKREYPGWAKPPYVRRVYIGPGVYMYAYDDAETPRLLHPSEVPFDVMVDTGRMVVKYDPLGLRVRPTEIPPPGIKVLK